MDAVNPKVTASAAGGAGFGGSLALLIIWYMKHHGYSEADFSAEFVIALTAVLSGVAGFVSGWTKRAGAAKIPLPVIAALCLLPALSGCADIFANKTTASYVITRPDGTKTEIHWSSAKAEEGLRAKLNPLTGEIDVKVDKASTQADVIQATVAQHEAAARILEAAAPLIKALAITAATKGMVPPGATLP
jgi:hypothetical protein